MSSLVCVEKCDMGWSVVSSFTLINPTNNFLLTHHIIPSSSQQTKQTTIEYLEGTKAGKNFPGSMGPKIQAAIDFVNNSKNPNAWAAIGDLKDVAKIFNNEEGTLVMKDVKGEGVVWRETKEKKGDVPKQSKEPHKSG